MSINNRAGKIKNLILGILAVICFCVVAGMALYGEAERLKQEPQRLRKELQLNIKQHYDMVVLGDSVLGQIRDNTAIPFQVGEALEMTVYNGALGGTCMGRLEPSIYQSDIRDGLSLVSLSKAIVAKDFTVQKQIKLTENGTAHFADVLLELSQIDFSTVKLLLIGYGVNDYHAMEPVFSITDPYDEHTYTGALRSSIRTLQNAYPDTRIVLITPTYTWYPQQGLTCEEYVRGEYVLEDYVEAQLQVAEELGIESIDLYHDVYPKECWEDWKLYSVDGLHPNEEGRKLLSKVIVEYLEESMGE